MKLINISMQPLTYSRSMCGCGSQGGQKCARIAPNFLIWAVFDGPSIPPAPAVPAVVGALPDNSP